MTSVAGTVQQVILDLITTPADVSKPTGVSESVQRFNTVLCKEKRKAIEKAVILREFF